MGRSDGVDDGTRRRTVLKLLSAAAGAQLIPWVAADQVADQTYSVVQGDRCIPVTPIVGEESVDDMYDWREDETHYSSAGTMDLQQQDTSILFLYAGPDGLSLVLVHGHYKNHDSDGGSVSMTFTGLPEGGEWVVEDDNYDGTANYDNWNHEATRSEVDWTWRFGRTDGGAFRGLEGDFEIQIDPAFNDESHYGDQYYDGDIVEWQVLSGDRQDPDRTSLSMDQPITLRVGGCDVDATGSGDGDGTGDEEESTGGDDTENADDGEQEEDDGSGVVVSEDTDANIETDGSVVVEAGVEVDGNIEAGGSVDVEADAEVDGNVEAGDDVTVGPDGEIDGNVEAGGAVTVRSESEIDGNVSGARVDVADSAEVDGNIESEAESGNREPDSDGDEKRRTKHEKRQQKHEKDEEKAERKHRKKQRKHEKDEEKKERKHRKKQRKHEKEEEKEERKHRKERRKHEKENGNGKGNGRGNSNVVDDVLGDATGLLGGDD